jgi:hypothetical protein
MMQRPGLFRDAIGAFVSVQLATILNIAMRAFVIMFVAAVVAKRFDVFAAVGYVESLAWSAGYDLVRELIPGRKDES